MGLAAAKNKRKLGNDPNNTKWSRNTDTFGQKILRAQGWQPGQYLGAKDAPHAEWHTEASSSHIRVVLKDDTMGLGAKRNNGDECVGLDAFQMLLGRLNGKSDETLETERKVREDMKLNLYVERKLGAIRFVRGGWLVGDQLQQTPDEEAAKSETSPVPEESKEPTEEKESEPAGEKSKKRKADDSTDAEDEKARKKEKKSKKRKADFEAEVDSESTKEKKDKKDKKSKKRRSEDDTSSKKSKKDKKDVSEDSSVSETGEDLTEADSSAADAKKAKKEKKDRKERKKEKKEKKEKRKKDKAGSDAETGDSISKEKKRKKDDGEVSSASTPAESTPSGSGYSTPVTTSTRYLARSRFIAQKRMAFADSAALNQIFMIKS